jgi:hypothetical protein
LIRACSLAYPGTVVKIPVLVIKVPSPKKPTDIDTFLAAEYRKRDRVSGDGSCLFR